MSARDVLDRIDAAARPDLGAAGDLGGAVRRFDARAKAAASLPSEGAAATALADAASALFGRLAEEEGPDRARALAEERLEEAGVKTAAVSPRWLAAWLAPRAPPEGEERHAGWAVACVCAVVARHEADAGADADAGIDEAWLLARARGESFEHPDPERAAGYVRLEDALRSLPGREPPPEWQEAVLAQVPPDTWWRRLWRRLVRWVGACRVGRRG